MDLLFALLDNKLIIILSFKIIKNDYRFSPSKTLFSNLNS